MAILASPIYLKWPATGFTRSVALHAQFIFIRVFDAEVITRPRQKGKPERRDFRRSFSEENQEEKIRFHPARIAALSFLEHGLFQGCENLESITIPDGVTKIGVTAAANLLKENSPPSSLLACFATLAPATGSIPIHRTTRKAPGSPPTPGPSRLRGQRLPQ